MLKWQITKIIKPFSRKLYKIFIALNLILLSVNSTPNYVKLTTWISSHLKQMFSTSPTDFFKLLFETYLLHRLTCVVPRVRGLHHTIVTSTSTLGMDCLCHSFLFWTNDASKPLTARSFFIDCIHVFLGQPLELLPIPIVLSTFLGQVSGSIRWAWPY